MRFRVLGPLVAVHGDRALAIRGGRQRALLAMLVMQGGELVTRDRLLRANAPFSPIAAKTASSTVRRACQRAGLPAMGAHRLRHTAACDMVAAGVPLTAVGQVLRHRSLQTTAIYARVDIEQLRRLALPWPGTDRS